MSWLSHPDVTYVTVYTPDLEITCCNWLKVRSDFYLFVLILLVIIQPIFIFNRNNQTIYHEILFIRIEKEIKYTYSTIRFYNMLNIFI